MNPLYQLLARIDSKLNLLLALVSEYQAKIPTVFARINSAKINLQNNKIEDLFFDLEWITTAILKKKDLRKLFEFQTLDLNNLKEELKRFLMAQKSEDALAKVIYKQRHSLARVFENLETFFTVLSEKTFKFGFGDLNSSLRETIATEKSLKSTLFSHGKITELENIKRVIINMIGDIVNLNKILISISRIEGIEGMQRIFLYDWNKLMVIIAGIFEELSRETKLNFTVYIVKNKEGLSILEFEKIG